MCVLVFSFNRCNSLEQFSQNVPALHKMGGEKMSLEKENEIKDNCGIHR